MLGLLGLEPTKISRDLRGKIILLYGEYKSGKTSTAVKFPGALLLGFEKGYGALGNIFVKPIDEWVAFKEVIQELALDEVKAKFQTIIVDTADLAWNMCSNYICAKHEVRELGDVPFGKAYGQAEREFESALLKIVQYGYGLVMISHDQDKIVKDEQGNETSKITPTLDKRARKVILRMTDINGYVRSANETDENGYKTNKTMLYLRGSDRFEAGSRWAHMPEKIVLSYDNLVQAIYDAVDAEGAQGVTIIENYKNEYAQEAAGNFEELKAELLGSLKTLAEINITNVPIIKKIIGNHLANSLAEATSPQMEALKMIQLDLKNSKEIILK